MGRTTPLGEGAGLATILDPEHSQRPSREEIEAAFARLQALRTQLAQEQQTVGRTQDVLSVAYTQILDRIVTSVYTLFKLEGRMLGNYLEVAADHLRILGEATQQHNRELTQHMPKEAPEGRKYTQLQLDLNARLLLEINEFI